MCNISCCEQGAGITIPNGAAGVDGDDGLYGGFSSEFIFETNTGSGPGSTFIRLNSATYTAVTNIYISETNADNINVAAFVATMNNSGNFGLIKLFKEYDSTKFWMGRITSFTDNGTNVTLGVTYILHNSSFAANDRIIATFTPAGAAGAAGTNGTNGADAASVLHNDCNPSTSSANVWTTIKSYMLPMNTMDTNGDVLRLRANFLYSGATPLLRTDIRITIAGVTHSATQTSMYVSADAKGFQMEFLLSRTSATTYYGETNSIIRYPSNRSDMLYSFTDQSMAIIDFTVNQTIAVQVQNDATYSITCEQLLVELFRK